jgi:DNA-binding response OmpR family regulator
VKEFTVTRVLSLDDDPEMLSLLGLIFGLCGYDHMRTTNSAEALSILQLEPIDLFTQDCTRPDMHGLELYRVLKVDEDMPRIPVLFISAVRRQDFADECRLKHGDEYLMKPFGPRELVAVVEVVLNRFGKHIPTEEERASVYEMAREVLAREFKWDVAQLDKVYERMTEMLAGLKH